MCKLYSMLIVIISLFIYFFNEFVLVSEYNGFAIEMTYTIKDLKSIGIELFFNVINN